MKKKAAATKKPVKRVVRKQIVPPSAQANIERACSTGQYLLASWHVENDQVQLEWHASGFPPAELDLAMRLIVEEIQKLKVK